MLKTPPYAVVPELPAYIFVKDVDEIVICIKFILIVAKAPLPSVYMFEKVEPFIIA